MKHGELCGTSEFIDEDGVRWTRERTKPTMSIMSDYAFNWKPKYNHFQRHSDVRPKGQRAHKDVCFCVGVQIFYDGPFWLGSWMCWFVGVTCSFV